MRITRVAICLLVPAWGCSTTQIMSRPDALPVTRHVERKHSSVPLVGIPVVKTIGESVGFGRWTANATKPAPRKSRQIVLAGHERTKQRSSAELSFELNSHGNPAATIHALVKRKTRTADLSKLPGALTLSDHDVLEGTIKLSHGEAAHFSLNGFSCTSPGTKASGDVSIGGRSIQAKEVPSPWHDYRRGLAGLDFYWQDRHVGQVIRPADRKTKGPAESVWIDPSLPEDLKATLAGFSALVLLAPRFDER